MKVKIKKVCYHDKLGKLNVGDEVEVHETVAKNWGNAVEIIATKVDTEEVATKVEKRKYTKG